MVSGERGSMAKLTYRRKSCLTDLLEFFESIVECGQRGTRTQYIWIFKKSLTRLCTKVIRGTKVSKSWSVCEDNKTRDIKLGMISTELKLGID